MLARCWKLLRLSFLLGVVACGGGDTELAEGGIGGTGISAGPISGFGSVFVNGMRFDTTGSTVVVEGEEAPGGQQALALGMFVELHWEAGPAGPRATRIEYDKDLEGLVEENRVAAGGELRVMGQAVHVHAHTVFDDGGAAIALADLTPGSLVEVSGYSAGEGVVHATRIAFKQTSKAKVELKGIVEGLNVRTQSFRIGGLTVDYSQARLEGLHGGPAEGQYVKVKGQSYDPAGARLLATRVERRGDGTTRVGGRAGDRVDIQGVVTAALNADGFRINGQPVRLKTDTRFKHGDMAQLTVGTSLQVKGRLDGEGVLVAEEIRYTKRDR